VLLHLAWAHDAQDVVRVDRTADQLLADLDLVALADQDAGTTRDRVLALLAAVVRRDDDSTRRALRAVGLLDPGPARGLGDRRDVMSSPAIPPVWNVRMVSWVPGSPIDWAAMMPTASPTSTSLPLASDRP
jgi:hypothetical protein